MTPFVTRSENAARFRGSGTALVTPFAADGAVDLAALRALVEWQIAEGVGFLVPCGSTGEAQTTLSDGERERVVATVVEVAAGRVPVMAGATSNDTARAVEETRRMCRVGADYILSANHRLGEATDVADVDSRELRQPTLDVRQELPFALELLADRERDIDHGAERLVGGRRLVANGFSRK